MDPYWAGMWNVGATANWFSRPTTERLSDQGLISRPPWLDLSIEQACEKIAWGYRYHAARRGVAALGCWRTLSLEQLACITGEPRFAQPSSALVTNMIAGNLAAEGVVNTPRRSDIPHLIRPFDGRLDKVLKHLKYRDVVGVTHGQPWKRGPMHDRHNMLAAELLVRAAELTAVPWVGGEQLARHAALGGSGNRAGDGLFVTPDGVVVVCEVTATVSSNFPGKVEAWVDLLKSNRKLAVVFIDTSHPDAAEQRHYVTASMRNTIRQYTTTMDARLSSVDKRVMVVRWSDWFPAAHQVSDDFITLTATRPTGSGTDVWHPVSMLDLDIEPAGQPLLDNSNHLYGIPHWLQNGNLVLKPPVVQ